MQQCHPVLRRFQEHKAVIFDGHLPKIRMHEAVYVDKIAQKPTGEID
jgi:hypothetical protein